MHAPPPLVATYRLQLNRAFTFDDAAKVAPYLSDLGISHLYLSPIFQARSGSMHGYDVVDLQEINPELGGEDGFRTLVRTLRTHNMGVLLDFVPNHMAVSHENPFWWDVLARGQSSQYARCLIFTGTPMKDAYFSRSSAPH